MRIDPRIDFAFKALFGSEQRKHLLIELLKAVLRIDIADVSILNPYNEKETPEAKLTVLDIKARVPDGTLINVEMQMSSVKTYGERSLYYWSSLFVAQLKQGEEYTGIAKTVGIHLLNNILFSDVPDYHLEFEVRSIRHPELRLTDRFSLHTIELPKLRLGLDELSSTLDAWCYFFNHAEEIEESNIAGVPGGAAIGQALRELKIMFQTDRERELYEGRLKQAHDALWIERASRKEGLEAGHQEGLKEGLKEGEMLRARKDVARILESRFGVSSKSVVQRLASITDVPRLDQLFEVALKVPALEEFEKQL